MRLGVPAHGPQQRAREQVKMHDTANRRCCCLHPHHHIYMVLTLPSPSDDERRLPLPDGGGEAAWDAGALRRRQSEGELSCFVTEAQ